MLTPWATGRCPSFHNGAGSSPLSSVGSANSRVMATTAPESVSCM